MMKLKLLLFLLPLTLFCARPMLGQDNHPDNYERHWQAGHEKIRVISYNIFYGFDKQKDKDRKERFIEWVREKDPEVLALEELCGFTEKSLAALARKWGHPYSVILKENGYPVGITSKKPIQLVAKITKNCGHGLLHVRTYGYDFLVTHLNPSNTGQRRTEAETIVNYIKKMRLDHCLLMGDFNAHSPFDADFMEEHAIDLKRKHGGDNSSNLLNGDFDYSVISRILSCPMIDACQRFVPADKRHTFPTPILMYISRDEQRRKRISERLDYIFVSPALWKNVTDAYIFNGEDTGFLSDHYPVGIDLCIQSSEK